MHAHNAPPAPAAGGLGHWGTLGHKRRPAWPGLVACLVCRGAVAGVGIVFGVWRAQYPIGWRLAALAPAGTRMQHVSNLVPSTLAVVQLLQCYVTSRYRSRAIARGNWSQSASASHAGPACHHATWPSPATPRACTRTGRARPYVRLHAGTTAEPRLKRKRRVTDM